MTPLYAPPADTTAREAAVRAAVLAGLGRPPGLYELAVRWLWDGHCRVNVHVGPDVLTTRIAHSYLLEVADDGRILSASPPLHRGYP